MDPPTNTSAVTVHLADNFEQQYGYSWDFVMVFKVHDEDDVLTTAQREYSMKNILSRLSAGGLETKMFYSSDRGQVFCKIRASYERLCKEADRVDYKLELDENALRRAMEIGFPPHIKGVEITDIKGTSHRSPYESIFGKYDTEPSLQSIYKKYGPKNIAFRSVDRLKLLSSIIKSKKALGGCSLLVHRLLMDECILAFYPLHSVQERDSLKSDWVVTIAAPWNQPIQKIKDYYGEKIGLYFVWLGHYTTWLIAPSIFGVLVSIDIVMRKSVDSQFVPFFALFMAFWSTFYLEYWKRKNSTIAMEWGMVGYEQEEQERPEFKGDIISSPINGEKITWDNPSRKTRRIMTSFLFIFFLLLLVISVVAGIFAFRFFSKKGKPLDGLFTIDGINISSAIASTINAVQIQVMNMIYQSIAIRLNDYENHRTDTEYEDHLIGKTFLFQFVNSYASCFYIAFLKNLIPGDECNDKCMSELSISLGIIFVLRLTSGNFTEVCLPYIKRQLAKRSTASNALPLQSKRPISDCEHQYALGVYDNMGTFMDYSEMVIQFGYVTLFVVAFPLAPLLALINNYAEIRIDAYKLSKETRRPEPRGAEDIGTWYTILEIMGTVSVVTNAAIIVFTSTHTTEGWEMSSRMWLFIVIEHIVLLTKFFLALIVDDVPEDVKIQLDRNKFMVDKVILRIADDDDSDLIKDNKVRIDLTVHDTDEM